MGDVSVCERTQGEQEMKRLKAITFCLLCAIVAICFTACDDRVVVDKVIEDVRYTPQTQETVTDYEYKYNFWTGDFVLVPNVHTETVPEKYEVLYFVTYNNGDTSHCWEVVNKTEYDAAVDFLEKQTEGGEQ